LYIAVPHDSAPLAPRSFVGLGRVGGAPDDRGEWAFPIRDLQPLQAQSPASPVDFLAFRRVRLEAPQLDPKMLVDLSLFLDEGRADLSLGCEAAIAFRDELASKARKR
jgi:hypothetical protein